MYTPADIKVLVACEESQEVTKAFRELRYNAYSNDIIDCSGGHPEWHIKADVFNVINDGWDLIIAHPPCTYIANSGVSWLYNKDKTENEDRWNEMRRAAHFFRSILNNNCRFLAVENPIPHKYAIEIIGRKYDQIVQPYQFGHPESKATCLWIKGLPVLKETNNVKQEYLSLPKNKAQRLHFLPPSPERQKLRSKTFPGIAKAMAEQWGQYVLDQKNLNQ